MTEDLKGHDDINRSFGKLRDWSVQRQGIFMIRSDAG